MSDVDNILGEINITESSLLQIKADIDAFEQVLNRVRIGYGDVTYLNENYHKLILSTKDLSSHLNVLRRTIDMAGRHMDLRSRARNLHGQAMAQLRRVQNLGVQVQQTVSTMSKAKVDQTRPSENLGGAQPVPLIDVTAKPSDQQQMQKQVAVEQDLDEQRARDMERLEADIVQVNELFTTMATYVHDQGDMIDSIGNNIEVAYEQVQGGTTHLSTASIHRKSARRKKCICLIVGLVLLAILGLALGLSFNS